MANKEMKVMMQGAAVLTLASFIAKILSAIYRVPFQNLAGDEGFYVYQQVYPIYGLAMTLALSGLPQFISKYVAEKKAQKAQATAIAELFPLIIGLGLVLWGITFFTSFEIAHLMGDDQLEPLVKVVSFTFLLMPALSVIRGEFQGNLVMTPTAISQVIEQIIRVTVILVAAWSFKQFGWSVYHTGTVAMAGAVFGGIAALLVLMYYQQKNTGSVLPKLAHKIPHRQRLLKRVVVEGGLMTIYSGFLILFQLVDSFTIKKYLVDYGLGEQAAKIAKGIYDRGQPLVQLGLVVTLALSSSFLPMLTRDIKQKNQRLFVNHSQMFLRLTSMVAVAASVGLAILLPYVNYGLFKDNAGNTTLRLFVFSIGLMAMIQTYQSIAQSQNKHETSLKAAGIGLVSKAIATPVLTQLFGTVGASLATLIGLVATLWVLRKACEREIQNYRKKHFLVKLMLSLMGMSAVLLIYRGGIAVSFGTLTHRGGALVAAVCGVVIGGASFIFLAVRLKLLSVREWLLIPYGNKLLRWKKGV